MGNWTVKGSVTKKKKNSD